MGPMTIMALAQLVMGAAGAAQKGIASYKQGKEAKELSGLKRPAYMIPEEAKNALNTAQMAYNNPIMTGNTLLNNQIENTTANAVANAGKIGMSGGDQLAALGGAMAQENTAKISAYQNALANKNNLMGTYLGELNNMSGLKEKAFDWNTAQPYLNTMKAVQALKQTSQANAGGALQDVVTGLGAGANTMLQNNTLNGANGRINPLTGGLSDAAGAESQAAELAQSKINPIDRTPQNLSTLLGQKIEPIKTTPSDAAGTESQAAELAQAKMNPIDRTPQNLSTLLGQKIEPIKTTPTVLNPTKIVTPTGGVVSNTEKAENLIDNDAAFNEASGKFAYEKKFAMPYLSVKKIRDMAAKKELYSKLISSPQLLQAIIRQ